MAKVKIGNRYVGDGEKTFIIAEIGINHNGSTDNALQLVEKAYNSGCDAVKFQKRTPKICVPKDQWNIERDTPWGRIPYIEYRSKIELNYESYKRIDELCNKLGIIWFASCWDEEAVDFIKQFNPPVYKAASASLTDINLLKMKKDIGRPLIISTGMSTLEEIKFAVKELGTDNLLIAHSTSTYPCPVYELNLKVILTLRKMYPEVPIGYSGHEVGLAPTFAAVSLGATFVERHITLDRAMWGTDQAASVEPQGFVHMISHIRDIELSLGDGIKKVYDSELGPKKKLRRV